MIRINQIKLPVSHSEEDLINKIKKTLKLNTYDFEYKILKRSIDGRKKPDLFYVYSIAVANVDSKIVSKLHNNNITVFKEKKYIIPKTSNDGNRPIVIGAGPAGLFCAYVLTLSGMQPIVLERGKQAIMRKLDVEEFWETGILKPNSNVQFGEGGAGTFSDGKLNTGVKDPVGRNNFVLETFVKFGAPSNILYENKPHIGTDILINVIVNMRDYLVNKGCEFKFDTCVNDFIIENNKLIGVRSKTKEYYSDSIVLAIGHSARDTFEKLYEYKIPMEAKNFAVGFRVEHPQIMINRFMYGDKYANKLAAAPYKVTSNFPNGRGVYSFCMCPGGFVVNSSSFEGKTVVNGMSYSGRDSKNANSAIIISVTQNDFPDNSPLGGMHYQELLESKNYELGQGKIPQQLFGDYSQNIASSSYGEFASCTKGQTVFANLRGLFSEDMENSFLQGMNHFSNIIPGFNRSDAIMSGIESRTSSPIRVNRNENFESSIEGLFPCGEGAGYAGGITSAAMDGIKVAEAIIKKRG